MSLNIPTASEQHPPGPTKENGGLGFLFIHPKIARQGEYYEFPLGMAYVTAVLRKQGFAVHVLDLCHGDEPIVDQIRAMMDSNINVVCTGGMSVKCGAIEEVVKAVRAINPTLPLVVGGPIVTADPPLAAEILGFDYGIIGEGELTIAELAEALLHQSDITQVKGLIYKVREMDATAGTYRSTPERESIRDIDSLPYPDYEGFNYRRYLSIINPTCSSSTYTLVENPRPVSIATTRSCPYNCTFCYHPLGRIYRQRSLANVRGEIEYLVKNYNINQLHIFDELFSVNKKRVMEFCDLIEPFELKWAVQLRVPDVDEEMLLRMRSAGACNIGYGVESMSATVLKSMKKNITPDQIRRALELTRKAKMGVTANLIFGDPAEDDHSVRESLDWWFKSKQYAVNLFMVRVLPDSKIYQDAVASGAVKDKAQFMRDGFPLINVSKLTNRAYTKLRNFTLWYANDERLVPVGKVISSRMSDKGGGNCGDVDITVECPDCHVVTEYKGFRQQNYFTFRRLTQLMCRNCWQRVYVRTKQVFRENYQLRNNTLLDFCVKQGIDFVQIRPWVFGLVNYLRMVLVSDRALIKMLSFMGKRSA